MKARGGGPSFSQFRMGQDLIVAQQFSHDALWKTILFPCFPTLEKLIWTLCEAAGAIFSRTPQFLEKETDPFAVPVPDANFLSAFQPFDLLMFLSPLITAVCCIVASCGLHVCARVCRQIVHIAENIPKGSSAVVPVCCGPLLDLIAE